MKAEIRQPVLSRSCRDVYINLVEVSTNGVDISQPDVLELQVACCCCALCVALLVVDDDTDRPAYCNRVEAIEVSVASYVHCSLELAEA